MGRVKGESNEDRYVHILPAGTSAQIPAGSSLQLAGSQGEGTCPSTTHTWWQSRGKTYLAVP